MPGSGIGSPGWGSPGLGLPTIGSAGSTGSPACPGCFRDCRVELPTTGQNYDRSMLRRRTRRARGGRMGFGVTLLCCDLFGGKLAGMRASGVWVFATGVPKDQCCRKQCACLSNQTPTRQKHTCWAGYLDSARQSFFGAQGVHHGRQLSTQQYAPWHRGSRDLETSGSRVESSEIGRWRSV